MRLAKLLGSQRHFLNEIEKGYNAGVRFFVALKGRQLGITTLSAALDLFWQMRHAGMTSAMVSDDESNRDSFRATLDQYLAVLPREYKVSPKIHNRNLLVLKNGSRIHYLVAGSRKKAGLGQGKGLNFCHGTEVSSWGDPEGFASLMASLAENHPARLYIFESTAKGLNHYHELWRTACRARFMHPIFIGWWTKEDYAFAEGSSAYKTYWTGKVLPEERDWIRDIKRQYGHDITPGQLAWWRYQLFEKFQGDESMLMQEHAPTAELAFQLTGDQFFSSNLLVALERACEELLPDQFRYEIGNEFHETRLIEAAEGELSIWQAPIDGATYVIGADSAYGSSEWKDNFAIEVLRCYADGCEQVAEYLTPRCSMTAFAWIIAHLAGAYRNSTVIMEVNGSGRGVLDELMKLPYKVAQREAETGSGGLTDVLAGMRHYLYKRPDSLSGNYLLQWSTNQATKLQAMNGFKDAMMMNRLTLRSTELVEQCKGIVQDGSFIGAEGRNKDDAVIAMSLAVEAWKAQVQQELMEAGRTREAETQRVAPKTTLNWVVEGFMNKLQSEGEHYEH